MQGVWLVESAQILEVLVPSILTTIASPGATSLSRSNPSAFIATDSDATKVSVNPSISQVPILRGLIP